MPTVTIIGASGYTGQEALDRVLRHPELDVVSLGSDSLAGSGASALDPRLNGSLPRFVRNEEALATELVRLATDEEHRAALAEASVAHAARFSWERTARETDAAIERALRTR